MKHIAANIKDKYFSYNPNEFFPIYEGDKLVNRREFHLYRLRWIFTHRHDAYRQFTHYGS